MHLKRVPLLHHTRAVMAAFMIIFTAWISSFVAAQTSRQAPATSTDAPTSTSIPNSAAAWAKSQCDGKFAGYIVGSELKPWTNSCAHFVANAYGLTSCGEESASALWRALTNKTAGKLPAKGTPEGVLVFWSYTDDTGKDLGGHVGIYAGNTQVISTAGKLTQPICQQDVDTVAAWLATNGRRSQYLGYAPAPKEWHGPLLLSPSATLDFGKVGIDGKGSTKTLTLVNTWTRPITVWALLKPMAIEVASKDKDGHVTGYTATYRQGSHEEAFAVTDKTLNSKEGKIVSAGQSADVNINFTPASPDTASAEVHFLIGSSRDNAVGITTARVTGQGTTISQTSHIPPASQLQAQNSPKDVPAAASHQWSIVYIESHYVDPSLSDNSLAVASIDGSDPRRISHVSHVGDATQLLKDRKGELPIIDLDCNPRWLPGGGRIVFVGKIISGSPLSRNLHIPASKANITASDVTQILEGSESGKKAQLGNHYDIGKGRDLWIIDRDGSNLQRLTQYENCMGFAISPDGKKIVFTRQKRLISTITILPPLCVVDIATKKVAVISTAKAPFVDDQYGVYLYSACFSDFAWSPDSRRIAFSPHYHLTGNIGDGNVWVVDADGTHLHSITVKNVGNNDVDKCENIRWWPDGKITFDRRGGSWVIGSDGSGLKTVLESDDHYPLGGKTAYWFSPDGSKVVFNAIKPYDGFFLKEMGSHNVSLICLEKDTYYGLDLVWNELKPDGGPTSQPGKAVPLPKGGRH